MLIAGYIPESFVDWRGKMVATVFTYGCNFRCPFCHNYTLVTEPPTALLSEDNVIEEIKGLKGWIDGICITGGEPTIHKDLKDFVKKLSKIAPVKLDTNGTEPSTLIEVIPYISYVAMDIKAPKYRYNEFAGVSVNMEKIEESIDIIKKYSRDYEFRTTAVPLLNEEDFEEIALWLSGAKRYVIQQFSSQGGTLNKEFENLSPHEPQKLHQICDRIKDNFDECLIANL